MSKRQAITLARAILTHSGLAAGVRRVQYSDHVYWVVDVYLPDETGITVTGDDLATFFVLFPLFHQGYLRPDDFKEEDESLSHDPPGSPVSPEESEESEESEAAW